jgi:hypothetical protein
VELTSWPKRFNLSFLSFNPGNRYRNLADLYYKIRSNNDINISVDLRSILVNPPVCLLEVLLGLWLHVGIFDLSQGFLVLFPN